MGFTCGIIGLPNVGKSTIFNALTSAKAASENFPFCTIEPNTGAVPVPDLRLDELAKIAKSQKKIPTQMTFVDIAGLIRGASKGEGLGNQFLGHIRSVDAVAHIVRCFDDENIVHVDGEIDPVRDIDTIETELLLSDLDSVQKQAQKLAKLAKSNDKDAKLRYEGATLLEAHLSEGKPARAFASELPEEVVKELVRPLLTAKPVLFVANVEEEHAALEPGSGVNPSLDRLNDFVKERNAKLVVISGKVESEISELPSDERKDYLETIGLEQSGLDRLTLAGYQLLNLITYFTAGPKEARAWTIEQGTKAPGGAGKIHSDFEKGFIRAEVISYEDYVNCGGEVGAKEKGKLRVEGKEYVLEDGDVVHFRFNV